MNSKNKKRYGGRNLFITMEFVQFLDDLQAKEHLTWSKFEAVYGLSDSTRSQWKKTCAAQKDCRVKADALVEFCFRLFKDKGTRPKDLPLSIETCRVVEGLLERKQKDESSEPGEEKHLSEARGTFPSPKASVSGEKRQPVQTDVGDNAHTTSPSPIASLAGVQEGRSAALDSAGDLAPQRPSSTVSKHIDSPAPGWTPPSPLPNTGELLIGRDAELQELMDAWEKPNFNIVYLEAWGGAGKSCLVNKWLARMARNSWPGIEQRLEWSFYSQATSHKDVTEDSFIAHAFQRFGVPGGMINSYPVSNGEKLAEQICKQRTLLVLDGLELLQYPEGERQGQLTEKAWAIRTLLVELAKSKPGFTLCVVTTRLPLHDLGSFVDETVRRIQLDRLTSKDGATLLRKLGVEGFDGELQKASEEFGGHCLALTLLAGLLCARFHGDVRRRVEVGPLLKDERYGGHAHRVMASYEKWFQKEQKPELDVLRLVGLFNGRAEAEALDELRKKPTVPGLNEQLVNLSVDRWREVIHRLRGARLLLESPDSPDTLDAHLLVREHFGTQLQEKHHLAWEEGHLRLYNFCAPIRKDDHNRPEVTIERLYTAVFHGCQAGRRKEAFEQVYWPRIAREQQAFSTRQLGRWNADLVTLLSFFSAGDEFKLVAEFTGDRPGLLPGLVGSRYRALGMLREAIKPIQVSQRNHKDSCQFNWAALRGRHLSEIHLTLGELKESEEYADRAVELARESKDTYQEYTELAVLGTSRHHLGDFPRAEVSFMDAEKVLGRMLYSLWGFRYCELLLDDWPKDDVQRRDQRRHKAELLSRWMISPGAKKIGQKDVEVGLGIVGEGLALLARVKTRLLRLQEHGQSDSSLVQKNDQAVQKLRDAGRQDFIPLGLLTSAALHRHLRNWEKAKAALEETQNIAKAGHMKLHLADCYLEWVRLNRAQGRLNDARESLEKAESMVRDLGYGRRTHVIDGLR